MLNYVCSSVRDAAIAFYCEKCCIAKGQFCYLSKISTFSQKNLLLQLVETFLCCNYRKQDFL